MKYSFPLAKTFAKPHTPQALVAHTHSLSVGRTVTVFFNTTWGTTINRCRRQHIGMCWSARHGMTTLTLTLKYQSHHYHFPMNLPIDTSPEELGS